MFIHYAKTLALCGLLAGPAAAKAVVIDFQDPTLETQSGMRVDHNFQWMALDVQGFRFYSSNRSEGALPFMHTSSDGNRYMDDPLYEGYLGPYLNAITITRIDGGRFDLNSFDIRPFEFNEGGWFLETKVNNVLLANVPLCAFDCTPANVHLPVNLHNISSATLHFKRVPGAMPGFINDNFTQMELDNFNLTPVPEPGTYALFALGLAGLLLKRRARPH